MFDLFEPRMQSEQEKEIFGIDCQLSCKYRALLNLDSRDRAKYLLSKVTHVKKFVTAADEDCSREAFKNSKPASARKFHKIKPRILQRATLKNFVHSADKLASPWESQRVVYENEIAIKLFGR